ncbi:MAG: phosphoglucosamine mutase [Candidatus Nanopelagicaceae bacterium]|nr:phosphoglucosamine mutase [Candidatus Nanopelagicaceae bacterium]
MALFGTDGIRGSAGSADSFLNPKLVRAIGVATGIVFKSQAQILIGRDTRKSGVEIEQALIAGLTSTGVNVTLIGVIPTPGLAHLVLTRKADAAIMITASHNPASDNGIKIFGSNGQKIADELELEIEHLIESNPEVKFTQQGLVAKDENGRNEYITYLLSTISKSLSGITVVVDCAHGSASTYAPEVLKRAGAEVIVIGATPDGENINKDCGSTHLDLLAAKVLQSGADLGIAHDGDADRALMIDGRGNVVDGDALLAHLALAAKRNNELPGNKIVATVMSNLGFLKKMEKEGVIVEIAQVGDRYVLEQMLEHEIYYGGEQSGHIILRKFATTGDGILTALQILELIANDEAKAENLSKIFSSYPQVLLNIPVTDKEKVLTSIDLKIATESVESELGNDGRILIRASGTEPLIRVMVEADTQSKADAIAKKLANAVESSSNA